MQFSFYFKWNYESSIIHSRPQRCVGLKFYLNWWRVGKIFRDIRKKNVLHTSCNNWFFFSFQEFVWAFFFSFCLNSAGRDSKYSMLMTNFKETNVDGVPWKVYPEFFVLLMPQQLVVTWPHNKKKKTGFPSRKCYALAKSGQPDWLRPKGFHSRFEISIGFNRNRKSQKSIPRSTPSNVDFNKFSPWLIDGVGVSVCPQK
jgi:hypothetical protein